MNFFNKDGRLASAMSAFNPKMVSKPAGFPIRLWVLIVLILFCALGMGIIVRDARRQARAVQAVIKAGGTVVYRREYGNASKTENYRITMCREWLIHLIGIDFLDCVVEINLRGVADDDIMRSIRHLTKIKILYISSCEVTDNGLSYLDSFLELEKLHLANTRVTDHGFRHLEKLVKLRELTLFDTQITDLGVSYIASLRQLEELTLDRDRISDTGLLTLKGLTRLRLLGLSNARGVTDVGMAAVRLMAKLEHIRLNGTGITDSGLEALKGLQNLKSIGLHSTRITNSGLKNLSSMSNLETLLISNTSISDDGLEYLGNLKRLRVLIVDGSAVTSAGLDQWKRLKNTSRAGSR